MPEIRVSFISTILLVFFLCFFFAGNKALAEPTSVSAVNSTPMGNTVQSSQASSPVQKSNPLPQSGSKQVVWLSDYEFWLSASVLIFGLLLFVAEIYIIRTTATFNPEQAIKLVAVSLIIISTLFIITAGFSSQQIAPAMGLFGTVAGYMLGKYQNSNEEKRS